MNETAQIERIELYLSGNMTADEVREIENEMLHDAELREDVEAYRTIFEGFDGLHAEQFAERLKQWEKNLTPVQSLPPSGPETRLGMSWLTGMAASLLLLVLPLGALVYLSNTSGPTRGDLFAQYFAPAPNVVANALRNDSELGELERARIHAMRAYDERDFQRASVDLEAFVAAHPGEHRIRFHWGVSLLAQRRSKEALNVFEMLRPHSDMYYDDDLGWFKALSLLDLHRIADCRDALGQIVADSDHSHRKDAEELLKSLR
jgi:hypothetical protein